MGGARGRKLVLGGPLFFGHYCGGGFSLGGGGGGPTLIRRPHYLKIDNPRVMFVHVIGSTESEADAGQDRRGNGSSHSPWGGCSGMLSCRSVAGSFDRGTLTWRTCCLCKGRAERESHTVVPLWIQEAKWSDLYMNPYK